MLPAARWGAPPCCACAQLTIFHSSLSPDDIPIKLRCAICSKLAINAFRLPCCEQAICETCMCGRPRDTKAYTDLVQVNQIFLLPAPSANTPLSLPKTATPTSPCEPQSGSFSALPKRSERRVGPRKPKTLRLRRQLRRPSSPCRL